VPIRFAGGSREPFAKGIEFVLSKETVKRACLRLDGMKIRLFRRKKLDKMWIDEWIPLKAGGNIVAKKAEFLGNEESETDYVLKLPEASIKTLKSCLVSPPASSELAAIKVEAEREEARKSARDSITERMPEKCRFFR
jgi:hypothetical protein